MKIKYKILIVILMVFAIPFVPPNVAVFSCNTLDIKGIHCHVIGMSFFGMQFKTNIYEWYGWTDTYTCGGVMAHPDRGYNCMSIEDYWVLPPKFSSNAEREQYEPGTEHVGISEWAGTVEGITDGQTGLTCYGKNTLIQNGQCIIPETHKKAIGGKQAAEYDEITSTVLILQDAVIEGHESLDPKVVTVILGENNTIKWINEDDTHHSFSSDDNKWSTGPLKPGESSSVTFNNTGTFEYHGNPGP